MFLNKPIPIRLFEFIVEGKFERIEPGQKKDWKLSNFPDLDSQNDLGHPVNEHGNHNKGYSLKTLRLFTFPLETPGRSVSSIL